MVRKNTAKIENMGASLVVLKGYAERRYNPLKGRVYTIGRGFENDLVFADDSISRRHSRIVRKGDRFLLCDRDSGNGTWVNNKRITQAELKEGDLIVIGEIVMLFTRKAVGEIEPHARVLPATQQTPALEGPIARVRLLLRRARRRRILPTVALGMLLVILVALPGKNQARLVEERAQIRREARARCLKKLETVRDLVKQNKWNGAGLEVVLALRIDPGNPYALEYHEFIKQELRRDR